MSEEQVKQFLETLWEQYRLHGRHDMPWRQVDEQGNIDPYVVLVSELMLQQTQVSRVIPKFHSFISQFPTATKLAEVPLGEVLRAWQGLGYNRRAKFLWQAAVQIAGAGRYPDTLETLVELPGVGKNTAGAVLAYAYNQPVVFVETNIRTVYFQHFFSDTESVTDSELRQVIEQTLDREHPREFYWALMDYGAVLKKQVRNISRSKHYSKQSTFQGSKRQLRGQVLRVLISGAKGRQYLQDSMGVERLDAVLHDLATEGLIVQNGDEFSLD